MTIIGNVIITITLEQNQNSHNNSYDNHCFTTCSAGIYITFAVTYLTTSGISNAINDAIIAKTYLPEKLSYKVCNMTQVSLNSLTFSLPALNIFCSISFKIPIILLNIFYHKGPPPRRSLCYYLQSLQANTFSINNSS